MDAAPPLLEARDVSVSFRLYERGTTQADLTVISDLAIAVDRGEILAIVGSSGSGKSLLAHAILGLLPRNARVSGEIRYDGEPLDEARLARLRGKEIALVPQSVTYLDPLMRVADQVRGSGRSPQRVSRQRAAFNRLGLPSAAEGLYPFQLSGGMARRTLFSTAIITDASLIIADEPTPGMHIDQAIEALAILRELADDDRGVILITHDIDLAVRFADKVAVFYGGTTFEEAPTSDFEAGPSALRHPYTQALWNALPQHGFTPIPGTQPAPGSVTTGCLFAARCPLATAECRQATPPMRELRGGIVRCFHAT